MDPRETLAQLFASWRQGDALRAAAHFAPDGIYAEAGRAPLMGRDEIVAHFTRFFRDGPRWRFEVDELLVEGSQAAVFYRFLIAREGGEWTQRRGCAFVRFESGAVAEWREYEA